MRTGGLDPTSIKASSLVVNPRYDSHPFGMKRGMPKLPKVLPPHRPCSPGYRGMVRLGPKGFSPTSKSSSKDISSYVRTRCMGIHAGEPQIKATETDYTASETLHTKTQMKSGIVCGSFGRIFKAERKTDGNLVAIKMLKRDDRSSEGEILLEICLHECLSGCPGLIRFHGSYKTSISHYALVLDMYDRSLEAWLHSARGGGIIH